MTPGDLEVPAASGPSGHPVPAWILIIAAVVVVVVLHVMGLSAGTDTKVKQGEANLVELLEGRYLVGAEEVLGLKDMSKVALEGIADRGGMPRRIRGVILIAEIAGRDAAKEQLLQLEVQIDEAGYKLNGSEKVALGLLNKLYETAPGLTGGKPGLVKGERELLVEELGWFGELALHPRSAGDTAARRKLLEPATRTFIVVLAFLLAILLGLVSGLILLIIQVIFACLGRLAHSFGKAASTDGLLAEAFAVWILVFFGVQYGLGALSAVDPLLDHMMFITALVLCMTVFVVAWPVWRGCSWTRVREAIGWTAGKGAVREIGWGLCGYLMALPLLGIGLLLVLLLTRLTAGVGTGTDFTPEPVTAHPIILDIARGGTWNIVQIYLVAVVVAPFLEETVFRGLLYRQLRTATRRWRVGWSVLSSAIVVSVIFAALHPQGLLAIPVLAAIAVALSLMREWRGSLIAPMVMHACNNGIVITMMVLVFN